MVREILKTVQRDSQTRRFLYGENVGYGNVGRKTWMSRILLLKTLEKCCKSHKSELFCQLQNMSVEHTINATFA